MNQFDGYDVSMSETHHIHKLDAPSGTAITLADEILDEIDRKDRWELAGVKSETSDEIDENAKKFGSEVLPITAIREGEVPGIHTVTYDSDADKITITHDAHSRRGFALGAVLAAEYTAQHQGLLTTSDLFKF